MQLNPEYVCVESSDCFSGSISPGYMGISPSSTENGDLSSYISSIDHGAESGSESGRSREGSFLHMDQLGVTGVCYQLVFIQHASEHPEWNHVYLY